ncbi:MAG: alpha-ketoglutarate-dependent dioxygenase AlkB [Pseudomonadota bacterium]
MAGTLDLFPPDEGAPSGFDYAEAFISPDEERGLVDHIRSLPLQPFQFGAYEGKRRVISFGSRYDFARRAVEDAAPPPQWMLPVIARVQEFGGPGTAPIRQVLCTEYDRGVGIGWHRDKPHYGEVFGLSLVSECRFRFRRAEGKGWRRFNVDVRPRSLYRMRGEARHGWEHSIPPVENVRYSVTFRTLAFES